jgi:hypothetical protein
MLKWGGWFQIIYYGLRRRKWRRRRRRKRHIYNYVILLHNLLIAIKH